MKKLFIILLSVLSLTAFAQQKKVAVYVTGEQSGISTVLGDQLVAAFAKSGKYSAIERTESFLAELNKEQSYQRSGAVNDSQIARLGVQFGVNYVCVAKMADAFDEKYITARLIDVETAEVINTYNVSGKMNDMSTCVRMASEIATHLSKGSFAEQEADAKMKEQEEARAKAEAERREQEQREHAVRQQYYSGYIRLGSFYVTKTLATTKSWNDVKDWPQRCQIGGWNDWRFPTESEANWIRYCFQGGNSIYKDERQYIMYKESKQYDDYLLKCMWLKKGAVNEREGSWGCMGTINVILVRGYK